MNLKNTKISVLLAVGLGAILAFVGLLGLVAYRQADSLWQQTEGLYEHPLTVRRALGELKADVFGIHRGMKDLCLITKDNERQKTLQNISVHEANVHELFEILYDRYLGPRTDIDKALQLFASWKTIREEAIRMLRNGQVTEAVNNIKPDGACSTHMETVLQHIGEISNFSLARGDQFYRDAKNEVDKLNLRLKWLLGAIVLLTSMISYFLLRAIRAPLKELVVTTERYRQGDQNARSQYASTNEFGILSTSFNHLAETIQEEMRAKENARQIADALLRESDLRAFCQELLKSLLHHTGSQVGAIYLLNDSKTDFEHFESIGLAVSNRASFSAAAREGEFGAALATRQIQRITEIPPDSRLAFSTVSGGFIPREIVTIPIVFGPDVAAMISLSNLRSYTVPSLRLVNDVWSMVTARLNGVLAFRKVLAVSKMLEAQNGELAAQGRELSVQASELREQNIELEMQKKQLNEANRLKSVFLSNMSHELRTPLNSVIALSGVLNRRLMGAIPQEEYSYIEVIERNGKNLLALINELLDLSRIESGKTEIRLSSFSVRELVSEVVAIVEPQAREKNIHLNNGVETSLPAVHSDFIKCRHIVQNIVANAVKFTMEGKVDITAKSNGESIEISVVDTGIGISVEHLPHIFDEFRQADESTSRRFGGTGLGLAIAKKYAAMLHGNITVTSAPGKGSAFTLRLPLNLTPIDLSGASVELGNLRLPHHVHQPDPFAAGKSILLVEDSEPAIIQISDILTVQGYQVRVARNGREALEQIAISRPDAMILDLMMPEVDGFQVLKSIRAVEETAQLPVLILTAKQITCEELKFLKGNHIYQLIQKGDIGKTELLGLVAKMVTPQKEPSAPRPRRKVQKLSADKPVILVVEDNPDNLMTFKALLNDSASIIEASDGQTGVEQALAKKPDIIFLDISLPEMDGYKVLKLIRNEAFLRHIPVIALTARAMKGDQEEILSRDFDGYISKPIDPNLLRKAIEEVLYEK